MAWRRRRSRDQAGARLSAGALLEYVIHTADNGKSYWNRAGIAFENKDGSFTFKLDVFRQTKFLTSKPSHVEVRQNLPTLKL